MRQDFFFSVCFIRSTRKDTDQARMICLAPHVQWRANKTRINAQGNCGCEVPDMLTGVSRAVGGLWLQGALAVAGGLWPGGPLAGEGAQAGQGHPLTLPVPHHQVLLPKGTSHKPCLFHFLHLNFFPCLVPGATHLVRTRAWQRRSCCASSRRTRPGSPGSTRSTTSSCATWSSSSSSTRSASSRTDSNTSSASTTPVFATT